MLTLFLLEFSFSVCSFSHLPNVHRSSNINSIIYSFFLRYLRYFSGLYMEVKYHHSILYRYISVAHFYLELSNIYLIDYCTWNFFCRLMFLLPYMLYLQRWCVIDTFASIIVQSAYCTVVPQNIDCLFVVLQEKRHQTSNRSLVVKDGYSRPSPAS